MMKITGLSHLFKWENLHNWWLTKYFFAPLCVPVTPNFVTFSWVNKYNIKKRTNIIIYIFFFIILILIIHFIVFLCIFIFILK